MFLFRRDGIKAEDFLKIKDEVAVLDVREYEEISKREKDLFPNFKIIPLGQLENRLEELDKDTHYYILCRSGNRASTAGRFLKKHGIENSVIRGGIIGVNRVLNKR